MSLSYIARGCRNTSYGSLLDTLNISGDILFSTLRVSKATNLEDNSRDGEDLLGFEISIERF